MHSENKHKSYNLISLSIQVLLDFSITTKGFSHKKSKSCISIVFFCFLTIFQIPNMAKIIIALNLIESK